ncbi:host specificity factor TipJ family phage tail protein [Tatumella terrea]|uniref:host specificity factor TipJ family phage tail protein n=1 Tax=Tatumella terrea TaxID=419007 RepID=UPI0031D9168B
MAKYEIQRLPGSPFERGNISNETQLLDWLNKQNLHSNVVVRINGRTLEDDFDLNYEPKPDDVVSVFDQPEGGVGKVITSVLRPVTKVLSGVMKLLGASQKSSAPSVSTGESANNDLTGQTNRARLYKGRPNIYGQVRAYPDLIQEALFEYKDNEKYITEWFEVGYGKYTISSVRYSESNLGNLAGASYSIYQPGDQLGDIEVGYTFDDVDNEEVPGLNESADYPSQTATTASPGSVSVAGNQVIAVVLSNDDNFSYFESLSLPHPITFVVSATWNVNGEKVTSNVTGSGTITYSEGVVGDDSVSRTTFVIGDISGEFASLPSDAAINNTLFTLNDNSPLVIGPAISPVDSTQVWVHVLVQLGPTAGTTRYRISVWQVDSSNNAISGTTETSDYYFDNNLQVTTKNYRTTHKFTPSAGSGRYAVSVERLDNSNDANVVTLAAIHAVNVRSGVVYPDDTMVRVTIKGDDDSNSNRDQKYNMLAERNVISYDSSTGQIDYTLRPSRSFADAVLHEWVITGKQDISRLDVVTLYGIAGGLPDPQLGYFDYTFSDAAQPLGERLQAICDVARVSMNWIGDTLTFWRDEAVAYPETVFSRSNMFWDDYKVAYAMSLPGGYDGVTLDYTDPTSNKKAYVYLQIDENGITEVGDATSNANQISLSGCSNSSQAYDRAYLEARKILYSRLTMTAKVLEQTQVVRGSVVQCPDMYDNAQQTGYLKGRDGDVFYTSERIIFGAEQLYVVMTDSEGGYRGRWECSPVDGNPRSFSAAADTFDLNIYDGNYIQSPSRYFIATDSDLNATMWRVDSAKPNGDNTQTLTLTEYSPDLYSN